MKTYNIAIKDDKWTMSNCNWSSLLYSERRTIMPFIDSKISVKLTEEKKDSIKTQLGQAISIINKPESFLMVGIEDEYDLYMAGKKLDKGAYVQVSLLGQASSAAYDKMTAKICEIYQKELDIPGSNVYVTYHGINDWGWNGRNF